MNATDITTRVRTAISRHAIARQEYRQLRREMATYRTESERLDLEATLARFPAEQTSTMRTILVRQADAPKAMVGTYAP